MNLKEYKNQFLNSNRNQTPDFLKGIAVIFMIQVHLIELFALPDIYYSTVGKVSLFLGGPPAAPVFMAVMGYFVALSKKNLSVNLIRGIKLILLGIILNVGLNFHLLIRIYKDEFRLDSLTYILGSDILPLAGMSIIILSLLKKFFRTNLFPTILFLAIVILISENLNQLGNTEKPIAYLQAFFYGSLQWSYFPLFPWLVYSTAGFSFYSLSISKLYPFIFKFVNHIIIISTIIIVATFNFGFKISTDLSNYYHHNFLFVFWVVNFLVVFVYLLYRIETLYSKNILLLLIKWVGKNVTEFYIIQWLIIGNLATWLYKSQSYWQLVIWFIVITISTGGLVLFSNKFRSKKISSNITSQS